MDGDNGFTQHIIMYIAMYKKYYWRPIKKKNIKNNAVYALIRIFYNMTKQRRRLNHHITYNNI